MKGMDCEFAVGLLEGIYQSLPRGKQVMRYGTEHANKAPLNCTVDYSQSFKGEIS